MKKKILLLAAMLAVIAAQAQVITNCEYFFDTDPGVGNGTAVAVTAGDSVILATTVPTTGLQNGFHKLYFRVQNVDGVWSLYEGRTFFIQDPATLGLSQFDAAEYFFDTDPGVGNATAFAITPDDSIVLTTTVPTTGLGEGFHRLFVRAHTSDGTWSLYEGRTIFIQSPYSPFGPNLTEAEYFYDTDPGVGNATAFSVTPGDSLVITTTTPTTGLNEGFHKLFVRAKNSDQKWSLYEGRVFYLLSGTTDQTNVQLTYAEYFFDTDPGQGNGLVLAVTPGDSIDANFNVPESLAVGAHTMSIRVRNSNDRWSLHETREFLVGWPSVPEIDPNHPTLFQNYPNPFNGNTIIEFNLVKPEEVTIAITDLLGHLVKEYDLGDLPTGKHKILLAQSDLEAGCYIYQLKTTAFTASRQMILLK